MADEKIVAQMVFEVLNRATEDLKKIASDIGQVAVSTDKADTSFIAASESSRALARAEAEQSKAAKDLSAAQSALAKNTDPSQQVRLETAVVNAKEALDKARQSVASFDTTTQKASTGGLQRLTTGLMDVKAGLDIAMQAGRAFVGVFQQTLELGKQIGAVERAEMAFRNLSGSEEDAAANLRAMKDATQDTLSEVDAMAAGAKLLSMGLATNSTELGDLTEMAVTLGRAFGRDATTAIDEFSLLLANQSKLRLDTFGIASAKVTERINELKDAGVEANAAFMQATFEQGRIAMERLGSQGVDTATRVEQAEAAMTDLKNAALELLAGPIQNVATGLKAIADMATESGDAVRSHEKDMRELAPTYEEYVDEMIRALAVSGKLNAHQIAVYRQQLLSGDSVEYLAETYNVLSKEQFYANKEMEASREAADEATVATDDLEEAVAELVITEEQLEEAQRRLNYAHFEGTESAIDQEAALKGLGRGLEDAKTAAEYAEEDFSEFNDELKALGETIDSQLGNEMEDYREKLGELRGEAGELKSRIDELKALSYLTPDQQAELETLQGKYDEIIGKIKEQADEHNAATKQILYDLIAQRMAMSDLPFDTQMEALRRIAERWGLIDDETATTIGNIDGALADLFETGDIDAFWQKMEETKGSLMAYQQETSTARDLTAEWKSKLDEIPNEVRAVAVFEASEAEAAAERILAKLREIANRRWTATVDVRYNNYGGEEEGWAREP